MKPVQFSSIDRDAQSWTIWNLDGAVFEGQATAFYDLVGLPRVVCIQVIVELRDTGSQVDHGGQRHSEMAV